MSHKILFLTLAKSAEGQECVACKKNDADLVWSEEVVTFGDESEPKDPQWVGLCKKCAKNTFDHRCEQLINEGEGLRRRNDN